MKRLTIAIDGPAASGKSTTAKLLAQRLGYLYIDTGAMYRAATLAALNEQIDPDDEEKITACVRRHTISLTLDDAGQSTFLDGQDVTDLLRTPQINQAISKVSAYAGVRQIMVEQQQRLAKNGGVVMDGRDIGTVVLPHAELKVFMVASLDERARRRVAELNTQGVSITLSEVEADIARRDRLDASRAQAPLKKAADARELDTSHLSIPEQVEIIFRWAEEGKGKK